MDLPRFPQVFSTLRPLLFPLIPAFLTAGLNAKDAQFNKLSSAETGVDFVSRLLPDHPRAYLYHSGMTCSGLALGDVDGDGWVDLYLANGPGKNALYLNKGEEGDGFQFDELTAISCEGLDGGEDWASGVAMADIDNDGDLDIYVCNYEAPNRLFLNQGADEGVRVRFEEVGEASGLAIVDASHAAGFCDYDGDGDLDLYLLTNRVEPENGGLAELPVDFLRPGVPSLREGFERTHHIWILDADRWGVEQRGREDYLFRNDGPDSEGQVRFTDVTGRSGISGRGDGLSCTWWDSDLDGDMDMYVCNDFLSEDRFYINNGDGTFTNRVAESMAHTTWFSMGSDFGDLDNDGDFDLLVADMSATSHYKSKVTMGIMGGTTLERSNGSNPPQYMRNALHMNEGDGIFREAAYLAGLSSSDWTWAVKMKDFDGDGWLDVFLTNGVPRNMNHSDVKVTQQDLVGRHMWEFFKEGEMRRERNLAFRGMGDKGWLKFEEMGPEWGLDHMGASYGAACADFDKDGDLDMVVMNLEENVGIYRNSGGGSQLTVELKGRRSNRSGIGAVVELEAGGKRWVRQLMPSTGYHSYDEPVVHFGLGSVPEGRADRVIVRWPGGSVQEVKDVKLGSRLVVEETEGGEVATSGEVESEGHSWFAESDLAEGLWHRENAYDDFARQPLLPHRLSSEGPAMALGDFNGDSRDDLYLGGAAGTPGELWLSDGSGGLVPAFNDVLFGDRAGEDVAAVVGDFDGDADLDLLVGRGSYEFDEGDESMREVLYLNDGKGELSRADAEALPEGVARVTGALAACDFDKDGDLDVFVGTRVRPGAYPTSSGSGLWLNDGGRFQVMADGDSHRGLGELGMVTAATWGDVDGDGWDDLVVAREWGPVAVLRNQEGTGLVPIDAESLGEMGQLTGWWSAVALGDVDGDGDLDVVAGNVGLNTKYKTKPGKPHALYYGDFEGTGKRHLVEVKREGNSVYPERGKSCSSGAMPFIKKKFETFHSFGIATLDEIYGGDRLAGADKFEVNRFESGVFLNDGAEGFRFEVMPREAQISPIGAIGIADFDGDGEQDLILGQNFFGPQDETGRYDGGVGQVLRGRRSSDGLWEVVSPRDSGVIVREAVVALSVRDLDQDGKPDVVMATNDGPLRVFVNKQAR